MKLLKLDNSYQNMVFKVGDEMDFDKKIKDKNLIIYCSNNLEDFAYEFKEYYYKNIKESLDITEEIKIIVALTDKILNIVNEEKKEKGLNNYAPLLPSIIRKDDDLKILVLLTKDEDNVWDIKENIKADYWVVLNIKTLKIEEFNKTSDKSYLSKDFIKADRDDAKEITKYMINKKIEYKKYFMYDLVKESMIEQEKYSKLIDDKIKVDDKYVNISDYIKADLEKEALSLIEDITDKMSELITRAKYSVITYYYDELFNRTVDEYLNDKKISEEKMDAIIEILKNYYVGVLFTK